MFAADIDNSTFTRKSVIFSKPWAGVKLTNDMIRVPNWAHTTARRIRKETPRTIKGVPNCWNTLGVARNVAEDIAAKSGTGTPIRHRTESVGNEKAVNARCNVHTKVVSREKHYSQTTAISSVMSLV